MHPEFKDLEFEIELLSRMVEIDTDAVTKRSYGECAAVIADAAESSGLAVEIVDGEKGARDGLSRPNIIVTLDSCSDATVLLESHFDIVPPGPGWTRPPFKLTIEDGKAYGRGSSDNKSGIAAAIGALRQLANEELDLNVKLVASVDEEIGGRYGADYILSDYGLNGDAAIVLDSGPERLYLGASGVIWGKMTVTGVQGHAGYPYKAVNAIDQTIGLLAHFESYRKTVESRESILGAPPGAPRQNVWGRFSTTMIRAGEKENVIPGICEIRFDRRLLPEEDVCQAEGELREHFSRAVDATGCEAILDVTRSIQGYRTPDSLAFVSAIGDIIRRTTGHSVPFGGELGVNDGSFFAKNRISVVCHGPIRADTRYHGVDEFVYLSDLKNTRDMIVSLGKAPAESIKDDQSIHQKELF